MILKNELASERSAAVERYRRGTIQLFIAESAYCRGCRRTVGYQQGESSFLCDAFILFCMVAIHRVDVLPSHVRDGPAGGEQLRQMYFNRIDTRHVVYHYANFPAVLGKTGLPLGFGESRGILRQCCCTSLE